jgi:hypothetical protein
MRGAGLILPEPYGVAAGKKRRIGIIQVLHCRSPSILNDYLFGGEYMNQSRQSYKVSRSEETVIC